VASDNCDLLCDVMPRVLDFPDAEHVQFPNAPLKLMLGQVRFPAILKIASPGGLAAFQEELRQEYSEYTEEQQLGLLISPEGMQTASEAKNYRFATADGAWSVIVNPMGLTLEASIATKYSTYEEFETRYTKLWEVALRHLGPSRLVQQGLRYVDFFDWSDVALHDWAHYIAVPLLGTVGVDHFADHVEHTITDARVRLDPLGTMSLKYGITRGGPQNEVGFLLDTDVFTQTPDEDITVKSVMRRFKAFHEEIHAFFNWATTDDARERFRHAPGD
jgi:uncharacterized protein (TIGR04255 family)